MNDVDCGIRRHRIAETVTITHEFPIDENNHVLPDSSLLVQNIPPRLLVLTKVAVQNGAKSGACRFASGTRDMALDILCESYCCHGFCISNKIDE